MKERASEIEGSQALPGLSDTSLLQQPKSLVDDQNNSIAGFNDWGGERSGNRFMYKTKSLPPHSFKTMFMTHHYVHKKFVLDIHATVIVGTSK